MDIADRVRSVFMEELTLEKEHITPQLTYNSIPEWDSVAHMHIIMSLEEAFELTFEDTEIAELTSVEKIIRAIDRRIGSSA
jgi:acyl carrier protein